MAGEALSLRAELEAHNGWVTAIATSLRQPTRLVTASRDKSVIVWEIEGDAETYARPVRSLHGHSHFVEDVALSEDGQFALTGSWDGTLRLWDVNTGETTRRFLGHAKDVLSVAFSKDNRQIVSAARDRTVKVWNTLGECKFTLSEGGHSDWVSCVRCSPSAKAPLIVSCGSDKLVKVWNIHDFTLHSNLVGHTGYLNTVTVSPDGSLCASGGKDGVAMLWDLSEGKRLYTLPAGEEIHALEFSPTRYWLCAATTTGIKIWDLETKEVVDELRPEFPEHSKKKKTSNPHCVSLTWSRDGSTLFSGYTDNKVRVWTVNV